MIGQRKELGGLAGIFSEVLNRLGCSEIVAEIHDVEGIIFAVGEGGGVGAPAIKSCAFASSMLNIV